MTRKKDLKKRVRERQARTHERYATALAQVLAQAPGEPDDLFMEMIDLSAEAARLGIGGHAWAWPELAKHADGAAVLGRLKQALLATDDPAAALLRAVVLEGQKPVARAGSATESLAELQRFAAQVQAGIGGVSRGGSMLAFVVDGHHGGTMVVCRLALFPESLLEVLQPSEVEAMRQRYPSLMIGTAAATFACGGVVENATQVQHWLRLLAGR
ncbi:MAG TPA: hypothetical protein VKN99_16020 [Polyangia bacterium]|nr:hypothetical protein [Polyangia bacterium]